MLHDMQQVSLAMMDPLNHAPMYIIYHLDWYAGCAMECASKRKIASRSGKRERITILAVFASGWILWYWLYQQTGRKRALHAVHALLVA